ncbi:uncharacterized protein LOC117229980 isoform X2 [Megalopta genalis]|nr:uncharacterized protein LOC117229980 isoform X2 [Megalopta genalis]
MVTVTNVNTALPHTVTCCEPLRKEVTRYLSGSLVVVASEVHVRSQCYIMEWNNEGAMKLIDAYKKRDIIWDPKHYQHFNKYKKFDAWKEISQEVGRSVDECRRKMERLLSSFRRENMKIRKSIGTGKGSNEIYRSTWFAYDSLKFILDKNKPRDAMETIQIEDTIVRENTEFPEEMEAFQSQSHRNPRKKRMKQEEDHRLDTAFNLLATCATNSLPNDDPQHFGNLVASKLRKFPESTQCAIQNAIMGVFLNAVRGGFDQMPVNHSINANSTPTCNIRQSMYDPHTNTTVTANSMYNYPSPTSITQSIISTSQLSSTPSTSNDMVSSENDDKAKLEQFADKIV